MSEAEDYIDSVIGDDPVEWDINPSDGDEEHDQVNQSQTLATERSETLRAAQGDGQSCVAEWVSPPARPLALGNPKDYQSFGSSGLISILGGQSIYGKDVPLGARIKVTTEVVPPTRADVEEMLAICLPPTDAPVLTVHWNDQFPPHCHICNKRCRRDEEYYKHGGFKGHKRCAEELRRVALAAVAHNAPERNTET